MGETEESGKASQGERAARRQRRAARGSETKDDALSRLNYINARLEELTAERTRLKEERKMLRQAKRSAKKNAAHA